MVVVEHNFQRVVGAALVSSATATAQFKRKLQACSNYMLQLQEHEPNTRFLFALQLYLHVASNTGNQIETWKHLQYEFSVFCSHGISNMLWGLQAYNTRWVFVTCQGAAFFPTIFKKQRAGIMIACTEKKNHQEIKWFSVFPITFVTKSNKWKKVTRSRDFKRYEKKNEKLM